MSRAWQAIRGYIWWTYPRGSLHYDVMVTLILAFIFLTPLWVDFHDKPTERVPHQTGVVVSPEGSSLVYQIDASAITATDDDAIRQQLTRVIEAISGEVEVDRYEVVHGEKGQVKLYKAWVHKPYR